MGSLYRASRGDADMALVKSLEELALRRVASKAVVAETQLRDGIDA